MMTSLVMSSCRRQLCRVVIIFYFFFFKQKTAYEMRISDWSSDVCSSDLNINNMATALVAANLLWLLARRRLSNGLFASAWLYCLVQIGRASCRERVCQYV